MKKTTSTIILRQLPAITAAQMLVVCKSVGNPDHGQYAPLSEPEYFIVDSFEQASAACQAYITMWDSGGGNWSGGAIYNKNAELVAEVSYNGRVWNRQLDGNIEIKTDAGTVEKFRKHYQSIYDKMLDAYCKDNGMPTAEELFED